MGRRANPRLDGLTAAKPANAGHHP